MKTPEERFALLNVTIETLPSMYVRGFKNTAANIVDYYRDRDDCMDQDMRSMVKQFTMCSIALVYKPTPVKPLCPSHTRT